jgi:hypothetical protein
MHQQGFVHQFTTSHTENQMIWALFSIIITGSSVLFLHFSERYDASRMQREHWLPRLLLTVCGLLALGYCFMQTRGSKT